MASSTRAQSRLVRAVLLVAVVLVLALAAYTGLWFYLARTLEARAANAIAGLNGNGVRAYCEEPEARGYPFRIGLACRGVFYENVGQGVSFRAGNLRSAAPVYRPFQASGELDGPAKAVLPFGASVEARWESLRGSARLARPLPERVSAEARQLVLAFEEGDETALAAMDIARLHLWQRGPDLEAVLSFSMLQLDRSILPDAPPLEGSLRLTVDEGAALLGRGSMPGLRGRSATIENLTVEVLGSSMGLALSGPVAVDADGLVNAELSVQVDDPSRIGQLLAQAFPEAGDEILSATAALSSLGATPIRLRIVRGRIFAGFLPLGQIPPL